MRVTLPYPPTANLYWRLDRKRGLMFVSEKARDYKKRAAMAALVAGVRPTEAPIVLHMGVYRPRRVGDLDNTMKVLIDSLKGIAFVDDSQIVEIHVRRYDDRANPRVELTIETTH